MIGGHGSGVRPAGRRHCGERYGLRGFSKTSTVVLGDGAVWAFIATTAFRAWVVVGIALVAFIAA
ncbi:hypothetical protein V6S67_10345 [Arthrobacter sp. Soc17.1.1.1]|uniref:hypothetical protein n=1 Tax=Arthrobacter sp. Soc17.1.1.1 TaxID=3121277 RepID=UPI002FE44687